MTASRCAPCPRRAPSRPGRRRFRSRRSRSGCLVVDDAGQAEGARIAAERVLVVEVAARCARGVGDLRQHDVGVVGVFELAAGAVDDGGDPVLVVIPEGQRPAAIVDHFLQQTGRLSVAAGGVGEAELAPTRE